MVEQPMILGGEGHIGVGQQRQKNELDVTFPELKVTQLARSAEPVIKGDQGTEFNPANSLVQTYGEYTLVLGEGIGVVQIFDKQARRLEGLNNNNTAIVDWPSIRKRDGMAREWGQVAIDMTYVNYTLGSDCIPVSKLPPELQPFVTQYIKKYSYNMIYIPTKALQINLSKTDEIVVRKGDGYIIIYQQDLNQQDLSLFIAFQTKTPQGVDLSPRNWKRYDNVNQLTEELPPDIDSEYKSLTIDEGVVNLCKTSGHDVLVYKDKVVIIKPGQSIDQADFTDSIVGVGSNLAVDPKSSHVVYYCSTDNPLSIVRLDMSGDPATWSTEAVDLPQQYTQITNLQIDPSGYFFTFESNGEFVIFSRDDLKEVKKVSNVFSGRIDQQGRIRGVDEKGHLVIYDTNFQEAVQELEKRRVARLAQGLTDDLFEREASETEVQDEDKVNQFQHLVPVRTDLETMFSDHLQTITVLEDVATVTEALARLRTRLQTEGLQPVQIDFITQGIRDLIAGKERMLAAPVVVQSLSDLKTKLDSTLTIASILETKADLAKLRSLEGLVDDATRARIRAIEDQFNQQSAELFRREGVVVERDVEKMVSRVRAELDKMVSMHDFVDWQEFRLPQLISRLASLAGDVPLEASETQKKILEARRQLQDISSEYEAKFKEGYARVRERASEVMGERVELIKRDMDSFADRLRARGFQDRTQAEAFIRSSKALEVLKTEIEDLAKQNPDVAKELDRELRVRIATVISEVERGGLTSIAETGQQMVLFGETLFPRWEGKVQEKVQRHVDLVFIPDERTKGPEVTADKVMGDVGIREINSRSKLVRKRLYQGMQEEDEWRYGSVSYRGEYVFPAYVSQEEYRKIKSEYADWSKGKDSKIRQVLNDKRQARREWYKKRQPRGQRDTHTDNEWAAKYRELLGDYAKYAAENHVLLFSRVDQLRKAPETKFVNGSGYVPEWQSHWTVDETTEHYLEEMAKASKMQLDLQEGLLNLKGHAGTGKDVLVKMFCNRSNRPYFAIDCSKWTTEFELSEDVVLEAEDGASKTVKVPSVVLNAITTPGAVLYFNEINAMPEQAQIFLHGLMDEKRTLTLKTSSGKALEHLIVFC